MHRFPGLLAIALLLASPVLAAGTPAVTATPPTTPATTAPPPSTTKWSTGVLGIEVMDLTPALRLHFGGPDTAGVLVSNVRPQSAGEAAGIKTGDLLLEINGVEIVSAATFHRTVPQQPAGFLQITVVRNGDMVTLTPAYQDGRTPGRIVIQLPSNPTRPREDIEIKLPDMQQEMQVLQSEMDRLQTELVEMQRRLTDKLTGWQEQINPQPPPPPAPPPTPENP